MGQNHLEASLHFVWATWDRHPLIEPEIERELYRYVSATCQNHGCEVLAVGGMPNHLHLLVMFGNAISLADLMRHVKGGSSHFIGKRLRPGEWFRWQASYGVFCVEAKNRNRVISYIANQKIHHANGTVWPTLERTSAEAPSFSIIPETE